MNIQELFTKNASADAIVSALKEKQLEIPDWTSTLLPLYEPTKHKIVKDQVGRKDKVRKDGSIDFASRIYIGLEQLLTRRITEFTASIPIRRVYHNTEGNETRKAIAKALESIYNYARIDAENIRRFHAYYASCEVFTIWYMVNKPNSLYGFNSPYKLKCKTYSPMDGVGLYPLFDETGDMVAMSFEYDVKKGQETITYFETYTADTHYKFIREGAGYKMLGTPEKITIGKIAGAYMHRPKAIYQGLEHIREEIEYTLSRNSDVIAYNSAPILKVVGGLRGEENKGEERRIYRVENGGDVGYVAWTQAIEALKYQVESLTNLYWTQSQMPDISFSNMRSLGNIGYDARQTLLTDAHLRIGDESGAIYEFLERETSVIKAILKEMNKAWANEVDNVEVEHIITPFIQNDEKAVIDRLMVATGGKPLMSQLDAIKYAGYSNDPDATLKQIQEEESVANAQMNDIFESMS